MTLEKKHGYSSQAKQYSNHKYAVSILQTVFLIVILSLFAGTGAANNLAGIVSGIFSPFFFAFAVYLGILYFVYFLVDFPLNFYQSFILEHRYFLTKQKITDWFKDQAKGGGVFFILSFISLSLFYYVMGHSPQYWWIVISLFWIFFSIVLAQIAPVVILPLFFKYKPFTDEGLKQRIMILAEKMGVNVCDVYEIDFSRKTLKANAAFLGIGKTKRVILADTLRNKYSPDEVEVILAHEFAHYKYGHMWLLLLSNAASIIASFYILFCMRNFLPGIFSLNSLTELAALPVVFLFWIVWGILVRPLENFVSRCFERQADAGAIRTTGLKDSFISSMEKIAGQNLADRKPHPLIKFFFFDHPPIDERIEFAKKI